jgi:hypothetical protein
MTDVDFCRIMGVMDDADRGGDDDAADADAE